MKMIAMDQAIIRLKSKLKIILIKIEFMLNVVLFRRKLMNANNCTVKNNNLNRELNINKYYK